MTMNLPCWQHQLVLAAIIILVGGFITTPVTAQCPKISVDITGGDICNSFQEASRAYERIYMAVMKFEIIKFHEVDAIEINMNTMALSNSESWISNYETDYEEVSNEATATISWTDGVQQLHGPWNMGRRRNLRGEEEEDTADGKVDHDQIIQFDQERILEDQERLFLKETAADEDFNRDVVAPTATDMQDHQGRELQDCPPISECWWSWCCMVCGYCRRRELQPGPPVGFDDDDDDGVVIVNPPSACDYVMHHANDQNLPLCLKFATVQCTEH